MAPAHGSEGGQELGHDDELLHSSHVWNDHSNATAAEKTRPHPNPTPAVYQPPSASSFNAALAYSSSTHAGAAATSDSDSDFDSDFDLEQIEHGPSDPFDGTSTRASGTLKSGIASITAFSGYLSRASSQASQPRQQVEPEDDEDGDAAWGADDFDMDAANNYDSSDWHQAGEHADAADVAGPGEHGRLECTVTKPQKEGEGTQNAYISYLVVTDTDFKTFQAVHQSVRRRYTDFVFLYKTLLKEYPQCAVPPLPDKHNMAYVRGDRFGSDFTARRAHSLSRFLKRLTLHPVLRRAVILNIFLESNDWNATMKSRPTRGLSGSETGQASVLESWTDNFLNAFTKPHKADKRFTEVEERARKLDDDLLTVSKTVARVAKREADLETDYGDLATQFQKLAALEPGLTDQLTKFSTSLTETSGGWKELKEHTDQNYLGSLKDMEAYGASLKSLLKTREQKQLDFEGLTDYLNKAALERDTLASHGGNMGASGFLRQKIEDVRGVDHEQARRERQRRLEVQIQRLQTEVEGAKKTSEAFDEEVVKEVSDFERIKAVEFRDALDGLADAEIGFLQGNVEVWERFIKELEGVQKQSVRAEGEAEAGD